VPKGIIGIERLDGRMDGFDTSFGLLNPRIGGINSFHPSIDRKTNLDSFLNFT